MMSRDAKGAVRQYGRLP